MPTLTPQQIAIQKAMLESQPGIAFGNQDYRGSAVGDSQSPNGVNLAATYYPPTSDQTGKTIPGAQGMIDKINDGLNQQAYGTGSTPTDDWWDNLQQAIGNMGIGPNHGGGTYVPYAGQQLQFEEQQNTENQAYGNKYLDILQQNANSTQTKDTDKNGTPTQQKDTALGKVAANLQSMLSQGYSEKQVSDYVSQQAAYLQTLGITQAQAMAMVKQLFTTQGAVQPTPGAPGPPGPPVSPEVPGYGQGQPGYVAPGTSGVANTGLLPWLLQQLKKRPKI